MRMLSKNNKQMVAASLAVLMGLVLASCGGDYQIKGSSSITSLDGKMMVLKMPKGIEWVSVDSAEVVHGLFQMQGKADTARVVTLYMNNEPLMPLVLEGGGTITVDITPARLLAKGTPLNDRLYDFIDRRNKMELALVELDRKESRMVLDGANIDEVREQLKAEFEKLSGELETYVKNFIIENFENPLGASVFMMMCSTLPYPVMTPTIEELMLTAPQSFKQDPMVKDFLSKAKENMKRLEEHQRMAEHQRAEANRQ